MAPTLAFALTPDEQFLAARDAARAGDRAKLERLAPLLQDHELEAYVEYWQLLPDLKDSEPATVQAFLSRHENSYIAENCALTGSASSPENSNGGSLRASIRAWRKPTRNSPARRCRVGARAGRRARPRRCPAALADPARTTRTLLPGPRSADHRQAGRPPGSNTPQENTVIPGSPDDDNVNGGGPSVGQDEDDHDPAGPRLYDVALKKTTTAVGPFSFGQVVKFDITVYNQGNFPVRNIKVADDIPAGFKFRGAENFGVWTFDAFSGNATTTIPATLSPGQSTIVSIYLEVQPTTNYVTGWDNRAEIYSFEDTNGNNASTMDIDSSPDTNPNNDAGGEPEGPSDDYVDGDGNGPIGGGSATGDEDDADPERIEIFDLALRKYRFSTCR